MLEMLDDRKHYARNINNAEEHRCVTKEKMFFVSQNASY